MADITWPIELPQDWYNDDGPQYAPDDNTIRTPMSTGPAKLRRRFTAQTEQLTVTNSLPEWQLKILRDFVKGTLGETARFTWKDFSTGEDADYRFPHGWSSVKRQHIGGDWWQVTLELEMMP